MSDAIYIRVKLDKKFYDKDISDFLFDIIKEGCNRRIAITLMDRYIIQHKADECVLSLSDSYNFKLVTPLMGKDYDGEVEEYRPEPLYTRLLNLQGFFQFILNESIVKNIEVLFTLDYDVEELESVNINLSDFAIKFEPMIIGNQWTGLYYKFIWSKM